MSMSFPPRKDRMVKKSFGRVPTSTVFNGIAKQDVLRTEINPSLVNNVMNGHDDAAANIGDCVVTDPFLGGLTLAVWYRLS